MKRYSIIVRPYGANVETDTVLCQVDKSPEGMAQVSQRSSIRSVVDAPCNDGIVLQIEGLRQQLLTESAKVDANVRTRGTRTYAHRKASAPGKAGAIQPVRRRAVHQAAWRRCNLQDRGSHSRLRAGARPRLMADTRTAGPARRVAPDCVNEV